MSERRQMALQGMRLACVAGLLAALLALSAGGWSGERVAGSAAGVGPVVSSAAGVSSTGAWRSLRSARVERTEVGAARIGRSIYVVGGFEPPGKTTGAVERYDIGRNRWRRLPAMPIAVNHPAVAARGGFLYVYGGYTDSSFGPVTGALQRYDPKHSRWKLLPSSPTRRAAAALVASNGGLYAVGGADGKRAVGALEVYDVARRCWSKERPMKVPREHIAAVATRRGIYVFGGRSAAGNLDAVERFDPGRKRWLRLPDLQVARSGIAAVVVRGKPVVFGGEELVPGGRTIRPVELFDPAARRWRRLPGMGTPRHGLGGAALGRRIYAVSGGPTPGFAYSRDIEFLDIPARALRR